MKTWSLKGLGLLALAALSSACLLPEELENNGHMRLLRGRQTRNNGTPIGTGDRFRSGTVAPRGLGSQNAGTSFDTILSASEVNSGLQALAKTYGIQTFTTPYKTYQGASIQGAVVGGSGGSCKDAYRVFINGNIHARERGSADNVLYFVSDLLYANANNQGLAYGSKSYTAAQVKTALSAGLVFIPLSNPDGVAYDQSTNSCWRKNRNPASGTGAASGVDLNRNFDFLWDFQKKFAPSVRGNVASTSPSSQTFHGTAPFSEPETKSVKWVLDTYRKVRWFVDLHSYGGDVLYSWGSDDNQSRYPGMTFMNASFDGVRGILTDTPGVRGGYGEYVPPAELSVQLEAARRLGGALTTAGGGEAYAVRQSSELYPTSGASDDYAYSRHFSDAGLNLVHSYTIEFGFGNNAASCPFYPTVSQYNANIRATSAAFMELLLAGVELGLGDKTAC